MRKSAKPPRSDGLSVFRFANYRDYLVSVFEESGLRSGLKSALAEALRCHPAYLTQVLKSRADLSLEQAQATSEFFGFTPAQERYFLTLVQWERAGTLPLKKYFADELSQLRKSNEDLGNRLRGKKIAQLEIQERYYETWSTSAIHILASIPGLNSIEAMADYLKIPYSTVSEAVHFMIEAGLLVQTEKGLQVGQTHLHTSEKDRYSKRHHINWRIQILRNIEVRKKENLHYSAVFSISQSDFEGLKESLREFIAERLKMIEKSKEEEAVVMAFDIISLKG